MDKQKQSNKQREFIEKFNELHKFLNEELYEDFKKTKRGREKNNNSEEMTFAECIYTIKQSYKHTTLKQYIDQLYLINNFRNTIVHDSTTEFYDIAEPSDYTFSVIETIYNFFLNSVKISDYLNDKSYGDPIILSPTDKLESVLKLVSKYNFSQFPVFKNDYLIGMITDNGITNFVANEIEAGGILFDSHTVNEVINESIYEENKGAYSILYQGKELYKVLEEFSDIQSNVQYVLISKSGNETFRTKDDLVGMFTISDIPDIIHTLR